jgi:glutamyl-tRNA synthetase
VNGVIEFDNAHIEDFIILRTDGTPIYNLAVVSDDVDMRITHVIRGDDHISNTPKQILLYQALGRDVPAFAHVPMILGPDGKRLSKRHGATAVGEYRNDGILPDAMVNFLALLGWNPGTEQEVFSIDELIQAFSLQNINKKSSVFDTKKLEWLNGQHIARRSADDLLAIVAPALVEAGLTTPEDIAARRPWVRDVIDLLKVRARVTDDIVTHARPFFADRIEYDPAAVSKHWTDPETRTRLAELRQALDPLDHWNAGSLEEVVRGVAERLGIAAGKLIHPFRVALLGVAVSPGIFEVATVLGRERTLSRLVEAEARLPS